MKNLLIILVLTIGLTSCDSNVKTVDELRAVKIGQTQIEILYLLGEPYEIMLEVGEEEWKYLVESKSRFSNRFIITIQNEKVIKFRSY